MFLFLPTLYFNILLFQTKRPVRWIDLLALFLVRRPDLKYKNGDGVIPTTLLVFIVCCADSTIPFSLSHFRRKPDLGPEYLVYTFSHCLPPCHQYLWRIATHSSRDGEAPNKRWYALCILALIRFTVYPDVGCCGGMWCLVRGLSDNFC